MFKRLRRMWQLSDKDITAFESLTPEEIKNIPIAGDGKAEFLGEGTEEEYLEQERKDKGLKGWYDRLKSL